LAFFYPHPHGNLAVWQIMGASLFLLCITAAAFWRRRKYPYIFVGWLWYLVTLLPVIGLVQIGEHALADRYTYLPSIGIFIIVAWGVPNLFSKWRYRRITLGLSMLIVVLALSICSYLQLRYWRNTETLFEHTIEVTDDNHLAHASLACHLLVQGQVDKAIAHNYEALRISPNYAEVHVNLGALFSQKGNYSQAITHYYEAIQIMPDLAVAQKNLGKALLQQGELDEAIRHLRKALAIEPGLAVAHSDLAYSLALTGKSDDAVKHFAEALRLKPDWVDPMNNLAWLLATYKEAEFYNPTEAIRLAERVCELTDYEQPEGMETLAAAYAAAGRFSDAVTTAEKALELAQSLQRAELIQEIQNRLLLYKAGKPYIELSPVLN
jgi:Flp pilus assembly protein TadD